MIGQNQFDQFFRGFLKIKLKCAHFKPAFQQPQIQNVYPVATTKLGMIVNELKLCKNLDYPEGCQE